MSHVAHRVRDVIILFEEIENTHPEHLKGDANVAVVFKPVDKFHTKVFVMWIQHVDRDKHVDLEFGSVAILVDVLYNFESQSPP